jgi:hypothetical protein
MILIRLSTVIALLASSMWAAESAAPDAKQVFDRQLSSTEREVVGAAEAMPAEKYNFAPADGEFKGVRTFALQVRHIAFELNTVASALLGEPVPSQEHENGPDNLTNKDDIVKYLKDAFAHAHRAIATLNDQNLMELTASPFNPKGKSPRIESVAIFYWHTYDHYGQMVEYLRMNNIIPPASRPRNR